MFTKIVEVAQVALYPKDSFEDLQEDGQSAEIPAMEFIAKENDEWKNDLITEGGKKVASYVDF